MQKVILRQVWTRFGLRKFNNEVNMLLTSGNWVLEELQFNHGWLKLFCLAVFAKVKERPDPSLN